MAVALIVIEVFIPVSGMSAKSLRISPEVRDGHADLADLAATQRAVGVVAGLRRQVEGDAQTGLTLGQVGPVERVGRLGRRVAGIGPHHPGAILVGHGDSVGLGLPISHRLDV